MPVLAMAVKRLRYLIVIVEARRAPACIAGTKWWYGTSEMLASHPRVSRGHTSTSVRWRLVAARLSASQYRNRAVNRLGRGAIDDDGSRRAE